MGTVSRGFRRVRPPDGRRGYVGCPSPSCGSNSPRASPWTPRPCPEACTRDRPDATISRGLDRHTAPLASPAHRAESSSHDPISLSDTPPGLDSSLGGVPYYGGVRLRLR